MIARNKADVMTLMKIVLPTEPVIKKLNFSGFFAFYFDHMQASETEIIIEFWGVKNR